MNSVPEAFPIEHLPQSREEIMSPTQQAIFNEALSLPPVERASLIEELLASFDTSSRRSIDAAWAAEAEQRIDAYESGELHAVSLDAARERINSR